MSSKRVLWCLFISIKEISKVALIYYTMKFWKSVIELRLKKDIMVQSNQFSFIQVRSMIKVIYSLRSLME